MHLRQKPTVKLINDLFGVFKVQKKKSYGSGCFMGVAFCYTLSSRKSVFLHWGVEATFNYIS